MRVFAIHDAAGTISEVISFPEDGPQALMTTQPGFSMTEIDPPAGLGVSDDAQTIEALRRLADDYRVIVAADGATLARRDEIASK
jgi:hypothetical protein